MNKTKKTKRKTYRSIPINQMLRTRGNKAQTLHRKLNRELKYTHGLIKLTEEEQASRRKIFERFKSVLEETLGCPVESHGSYRTETMTYQSDIDITVLVSPTKGTNEAVYRTHANKALAKIATILEARGLVKGPVIHIKNARVPVLKCQDSEHGCKIDLVVDGYDSIESAKFMVAEMEKRPYLRCLTVILKYFLKRRNLSEVIRGGLSSYSQFLLVLNFVQLHPVIQDGLAVEENLGPVLMDFFQLYGMEFPFDRATILVGETSFRPNREFQINIDDPCNPGHNVAAGCTALPMIREIFAYSYKLMAAAFMQKVGTDKAVGELWLRIDEKELKKRGVRKSE